MKVKLNVETLRCKGRIRAAGKKANPPFCWRGRVLKTDPWGPHTGVELYSRVTGKSIGYLGHQREFVTDPAKAHTVDKLNKSLVQLHFRFFLTSAQSKARHNKVERDSLRAIIKAAKASK